VYQLLQQNEQDHKGFACIFQLVSRIPANRPQISKSKSPIDGSDGLGELPVFAMLAGWKRRINSNLKIIEY
jgi:hypothetical protein